MPYKPMYPEMISKIGYNVQSSEPREGTAWIYTFDGGISAIIFDNVTILTATSEDVEDLIDWDAGNKIMSVILDASVEGLSVPQAVERLEKTFGKPDIVIPLEDINKSGGPIRAAVEAAKATG